MELQVTERYHSLTNSLGIREGLNPRGNSSSSGYVTEEIVSVSNKKIDLKQNWLVV